MARQTKQEGIPELRFPEFKNSPAWEQRKLGEISEKVKAKNKNNELSNVLTNSAEYGIIPQRDFFDKDIANSKNINGYYVVLPDDFVYNPRISNSAPVGPIKRNTLGISGIMSPLYYVFRTSGIDNSYLAIYFDTTYWHKFMKLNGDSGARADRFAIKDSVFTEMPIPLPTLSEQTAIGNFFQTLDRSIALHQRELENMKNRKKSLLQKMFPKNGENIPEIRFPEFKNAPAWEQRKSSDIFYSVSDKNHTELPVLSASQEHGMVKRDEIGIDIKYDKDSVKMYKRVAPGQFVIHLRSFQGGFAHSNIEGITSPAYTILDFKDKSENNDLFWKEVFTSSTFIKRLETVTYGIRDGRSISFTDFSTLKLTSPTLSEQTAIGNFFQTLDRSIALHQRKLDHLKLRKKALLQKMFP